MENIFEAVEVDADGREVAPYPTSNAVPMSGDEDGWVDYGNDRDSQQTVLNFGLKKKDPKQLIQEKLALLKQRAQKEADQGRTVDTTRDGAQLSSSSMSYSNTATESERIVDDLFRQFKTSQGNQQVVETSNKLNEMNEEIPTLRGEMYQDSDMQSKRLDEYSNKRKREKKSKKEKKYKKEKRSRKYRDDEDSEKESKKDEDPELDPEFFNVPSPKKNEQSESEKEKSEREKSEKEKEVWKSSSSRSEQDRSSERRNRDRSSDREKRRDRRDYRDRDRYSRGHKRSSRRSRSRSWSRDRRRQRDSSEQPFFIDKEKLRRIAIKRVAQMQATGKSIYSTGLTPEDVAQIKSGGASVTELTDFCRTMAKDSDESSDDEVLNVPCSAEKDDLTSSIQPMSRAAAIVMNIRNAKQLPIQTPAEKAKLRSSFPVSSGTHHRKEEPNEWTPVAPNPDQAAKKVFEEPSEDADDVGDISQLVAKRLKAMKKLKKNPNDAQTKASIEDLDKQTARWSNSKNLPGAFTGRVEAKMLTPDELLPATDKKHQAWVKKHTFLNAKKVQGGIGQFLLQKMGWNEGQGLGKENHGNTEPLVLDFNTSRKGLTAPEERSKNAYAAVTTYGQTSALRSTPKTGGGSGLKAATFTLTDKHPVSTLMEICSKRKWNPPSFNVIHESGPPHKKSFIMQVVVNGTAYQPSIASCNKKQAKTLSATIALQSMGMLPKSQPTTAASVPTTLHQSQGPPPPPPPPPPSQDPTSESTPSHSQYPQQSGYTYSQQVSHAYTGSTYTDSSYTDSAYTDSTYTDSAYTESAYTDSAYTGSAYTGSAYTESTYTGSTYSDPTYTNTAYTGSTHSDPTYTNPAYTGSTHTLQTIPDIDLSSFR